MDWCGWCERSFCDKHTLHKMTTASGGKTPCCDDCLDTAKVDQWYEIIDDSTV